MTEELVMGSGSTMTLPESDDVIAPDGSEVRVLLALTGGNMAHFSLPSGQVSQAVRHRTVEEIWYVLAGVGEMWRAGAADETVVALSPGVCLTIPVGVRFQFRSLGDEPLAAVAVTMPPWPGDDEAERVEGAWPPTISAARSARPPR
jgi:mannose-6-phosphate isomerase-like protein (cupin superfamily)